MDILLMLLCAQPDLYDTAVFKNRKVWRFLFSSMTDKFSDVIGIPLKNPIRIKIGMVWKKGKYMSNDMQMFLNFTQRYYKEHPLTGC